jgi:hypothetical protein
MPAKKRSLALHEDLAFQRREWRIQRVGWVAIAALLLAALVGLFGNGPLSRASATDGPLHVEYERFAHARTLTTLRITLRELKGESVRLAIDREYLDAMPIELIRPLPIRTVSAGREMLYEFAVAGSEAHITLDANPQQAGFAHGSIRIQPPAPSATVRFDQLIYP